MKILYVGAESANWVINLCNELSNLDNEITVVTQSLDEYDKDNTKRENIKITRINLPFDDFINPQILYNKLDKLVQIAKYDFIFGSHAPIAPAIIAIGKKHNIPSGIMLLDIPTDLIEEQPLRNKQWQFWLQWLTHTDLVMFNTHVARDEYERMTGTVCSDDSIVVYGIDMLSQYDGINIGKTLDDSVITVCRLAKTKNCVLIPEAIKAFTNMKYNIIGRDSGELQRIVDLCDKYDIEYEHYNLVTEDKKYDVMSNSGILLYPQNSKYIGGLSPFEAMYIGIPCIVPKSKIYEDLYGEHAFYFENNNAQHLYSVISDVKNMDKDVLTEKLVKANDYVKKVASFKNMASRINDNISKILTNKNTGDER